MPAYKKRDDYMYRLEMVDDLGRVLSYPLKKDGVMTVGRHNNNDIMLDEKSVSRNHCLLYLKPNLVEIEDLDSTNGVLLRGERITRRAKVNVGDELIIGENRFFLKEGEEGTRTEKTFLDVPLPDSEDKQ